MRRFLPAMPANRGYVNLQLQRAGADRFSVVVALASSAVPRGVVYYAKLGVVAGAYYGSAKLGLSLAFANSSVTSIWPPTGIALAALILWGRSMWPGVALGALLANAWTGVPAITVLGITAGNTLEALTGAYLLQRASFRPSLERVHDVLALVLLAAALSTIVSATIGVLSLIVGDQAQASDFWSVWRVWWLGDMGGNLLVAPALMVAATHAPFTLVRERLPEALVLALGLVALSLAVFQQETQLAYLLLPLLVWAVLRFQQPGAAFANLTVSAVAVAFTAHDTGPFVRDNPDDSLLLAQTFFGVTGVTFLILAAVISERSRAEQLSTHIARTLQESLLPAELPAIPGLELGARFRATGRALRVGGDFYDVFRVGPDSWALVVGDVCGKGPEAAAITALARYTLREAAVHETEPSRVLTLLSDAIRRQRSAREFCTAVYARIDVDGDGVQLRLASAGHPLPVLLHPGGETESVGRGGVALGVQPGPALSDETISMRRGDSLLIYTDGLSEAHAPRELLAPEDVAALFSRFDGLSAADAADGIYEAVLGPDPGDLRDDIVIVVLRVS